MKHFRKSIKESPYQIYGPHPHGPSDSEPIEIGKPHQNKNRARRKAEKLNLDIGGHRYFVRKIEEAKFEADKTSIEKEVMRNNRAGLGNKYFDRSTGMRRTFHAASRGARKIPGEKPLDVPIISLDREDIKNRLKKARGSKDGRMFARASKKNLRYPIESKIKRNRAVNNIVKMVREEFKELTPEKEQRVKNRMGELGREIEVSAARIRELRKKPFAKYRPGIKNQDRALRNSIKKKIQLHQNASDAVINASTGRTAAIQKRIEDLKKRNGAANKIVKFTREDYEYLLYYLLDEGYVDSYKEAEVIMMNMSEDWVDSILGSYSEFIAEDNRRAQRASKSGRKPKDGPKSRGDVSSSAYVTVGIPGSGKSTIAKHMVSKGKTDQHELDKSRRVLGKGPAYFGQDIVQHTYSGAKQSADVGRNTVLSNTSIPRQHRKDAINRLKDSGYENVTPILSPGSTKSAMRRNRRRTGSNPGEGPVPQFVMNRMARGMAGMSRAEKRELRSNYKNLHKKERFTKPAMRRSGAIR